MENYAVFRVFAIIPFALFFAVGQPSAFSKDQIISTNHYKVRVQKVTDNLKHPWALAFLPDSSILITEREGNLHLLSLGGGKKRVLGVPRVWAKGQGGLLDVAIDKNFANTKIVFISYSEPSSSGKTAGTAVAKATLNLSEKPSLQNVKVIFRQSDKTSSNVHFGSRIVVAPDGCLFITVGERGDGMRAQDSFDHAGSIIRINRDGTVPLDNPFADGQKGRREIWSIGHRNPQGATWNSDTKSLWTVAHGPRGGDEINHPKAGKNYGWPVITYGRSYFGGKVGEGTRKSGMEQPIYYWDPSIAPSGLAYYKGDAFPLWRGNLFVGALKYQLIVRLKLERGKVVQEERLFEGRFGRIRDVRNGPDGSLYFLTDENPGKLFRVIPL